MSLFVDEQTRIDSFFSPISGYNDDIAMDRGNGQRMNRLRKPLFDALIRRLDHNPLSFHVPGHKNGRLFHAEPVSPIEGDDIFATYKTWFEMIMRLDVTELSDTDDLHQPEGIIAEAQQLAAECFGAEETYFLVNGSTAGNLSMLLTACGPGDLVIMQRNVHKSVLNGLRLAGARAVFVMPELEPRTGQMTVPRLDTLAEALKRYPDAKAVFLSSPNYYGAAVDLRPYAEAAHMHRIPLLVDEAHGAHYGFHRAFPTNAMQAGADVVVQSAHKTLPALTMGAMLHVQGSRLDRGLLKKALSAVQSSSPSYPIMASLDIARAMVDRYGESLFRDGLEAAKIFREWISGQDSALEVVEADGGSGYKQDPLRVVLRDGSGTVPGYTLQRELESHGCWPELADERHVVLLFGAFTTPADVERLIQACASIVQDCRIPERNESKEKDREPDRNRTVWYSDDEAISLPVSFQFHMKTRQKVKTVVLHQATGYESAETIIPYPPGIPLLYEGERITPAIVERLDTLSRHRARCQGASDPTLRTINVFDRSVSSGS